MKELAPTHRKRKLRIGIGRSIQVFGHEGQKHSSQFIDYPIRGADFFCSKKNPRPIRRQIAFKPKEVGPLLYTLLQLYAWGTHRQAHTGALRLVFAD